MLSLVLPLMACAIVLTPVVASARAVYKREVDQYTRSSNLGESYVTHRFEQCD